jgi:glycolate oxidase iron-sulfur subunit
MQTNLTEQFRNTPSGQKADKILRSCVHCGFCMATCPTYQLLGDELDGPRGRIYQIKQVLEGQPPTARIQKHLDQCLMCRSCETTCPSGVKFGQLLEIGRGVVEASVGRKQPGTFLRSLLNHLLPYPNRYKTLYSLGLKLKPLLPVTIKKHLVPIQDSDVEKITESHRSSAKTLLLHEGCVQSVVTPETNKLARVLFQRLGYQVKSIKESGCCGAVSDHLLKHSDALEMMKRNVDAWWPSVEAGVEGILVNASGCGVMLNEYAEKLAGLPTYAEKAKIIAGLVKDPVELLINEDLDRLNIKVPDLKVAFHAPCTLQHGLKQQGVVENLLRKLGFKLVEVTDSHLCCGSAGTYSVFQPEISSTLRSNKLKALTKENPDIIVTANIGCQMHLQSGLDKPVRHWISLLV